MELNWYDFNVFTLAVIALVLLFTVSTLFINQQEKKDLKARQNSFLKFLHLALLGLRAREQKVKTREQLIEERERQQRERH